MMINPDNEQTLFSNAADVFKLIRFSPDIICSISGGLTFADVSEASKKILGYTPGELTGRLFAEFICKEDRQATITAISNIQHSTLSIQFNNRCIHNTGTWYH